MKRKDATIFPFIMLTTNLLVFGFLVMVPAPHGKDPVTLDQILQVCSIVMITIWLATLEIVKAVENQRAAGL